MSNNLTISQAHYDQLVNLLQQANITNSAEASTTNQVSTSSMAHNHPLVDST